ncbi:MAG: HAD-IIIC family phosphatase [Deltaproteobacteria bacterium]|nr:HAD-IIIC family phosphatase [Deltaproteobacteria bacterium]
MSWKQLRKQGRTGEALAALREAVRREQLEPEELERAGRMLAADGPQGETGGLRVRVLGQCTTSWLAPMIAALAWGRGLPLAVASGEFDNVVQDLTSAAPADVVVLLPWSERYLANPLVDDEVAQWRHAWRLAAGRGARVVQIGYDWVGAGPLGHHLAGDVAHVRALNAELRAALPASAYFVDLEAVSGLAGRAQFYDPRQYHWTKQPFSMAGAAALARHVVAGIRALVTGPKKVLVLDLDNTLWGGVVGETGPLGITLGGTPEGEAFVAFQRHLRGLARRGVLLAVASKNNPADAREPFGAHPDMALAIDDLAAFEASWDPKAMALQRIADALQLGLDSFVFFDDNPAEREHIRQALPEVEVVEVPEDPADYVRALEAGLWFEAVALTDEDRARTAQYAVERQRAELRGAASSLDDYLASLEMCARVRELDDTDMQRAVQLIGKTNQFNLTTRRHSEAHVRALLAGGAVAVTVRVRDRFGDHGLVSLAIAVPRDGDLVVDTWLMSCRVIGRTVEQLVLAELVRRATERGLHRVVGEYLPTAKNALVARLYDDLGFAALDASPAGSRYALALPCAALPRTFVARE